MQQKEYTEKHGGQDIKIPVIDIDCDEQSLFIEVDAILALHPRLRRELKTQFQGTRSEADQRARAAQKKVEKDRVKACLANMQEDWKAWVSESLIKSTRKDLVKTLMPKVNAKRGRRAKLKSVPDGKHQSVHR